tara:strand:+ start:1113 stop:1634 length:522 start_codon:yes stop_codon:yes gene_type:complete
MDAGAHQPNVWITYAITALVVLVVLSFRMRSMRRMRPLRLERLWLLPALYAGFAIVAFSLHPPTPAGWGFALLALLGGAGLGWQRGRMMEIHVDPETHMLNQKGSPAAMLFIIALIVIRQGARLAVGSGAGAYIDPLVLTDVMIACALGVFSAQRIEMYLRARRLLDEARAHG